MTPTTTVRRALLSAAGVAIALLGAVAAGGPAVAADALQTGDHHKNQFLLEHADTQCDTASGTWRITWTLTNKWNRDANIKDVKTKPAGEVTVGDPAVSLDGAVVPQKDHSVNGALTATELLPGSATSAKLEFTVLWAKEHGTNNDGITEKVSETIRLTGDCKPTEKCVKASDARYAHTFAGPAGEATIRLAGDLPLCDGQSQSFLLVAYFAPSASATWPQYAFDTAVGVIDAEHPAIELKVGVPACYTQIDLVWGDELINPMVDGGPRYGDRKLGSQGAPGNRSTGPQAWYNGGSASCAAPAATMVSACDGTVTVHLSNGADAHYAAPFKVTAGLDGPAFVKEVSVQPGESKDVVVPAESADKITVTVDGEFVAEGRWQPGHCTLPTVGVESTCDSFVISVTNPAGNLPAEVTIAYGDQSKTLTVGPGKTEKVTFTPNGQTEATVTFADYQRQVTAVYTKPSDCASGSPSPSPESSTTPSPPASPSPSASGSGGGLPVTGVQVGLMAGIGAVLLGAGAVLLFGARRRKLTEVE